MNEHPPPIRTSERRALAAAQEIEARRILCTTLGRAQAALRLSVERPTAHVACWFLDDYRQRLAADECGGPANLFLPLATDAPQDAIDLAVVPISMSGEAELARDLLQSAWQRLDVGGALVTAVDNPHDRWVGQQLGAWFDHIRPLRHDDATTYVARKSASPRKVKDFQCEFAFRDRGRLLRAASRPGVFSHRRIDPGARRLLEAANPPPGARILDIGCGAGVVGLALAARDPACSVLAVDSHTRAIQCTQMGTALNKLTNVTTLINSTGAYGEPMSFDFAALNPPYFAAFSIAELFVEAARRLLRPGGRVAIVTKRPAWYAETMPVDWTNVEIRPSKEYHIVTASKR